MAAYLKLVMNLFQIPRLENAHIDALLKLASSKDSKLLKIIPFKYLTKPSITKGEEVMWIEDTSNWMQPIITSLNDQVLVDQKFEAHKLGHC